MTDEIAMILQEQPAAGGGLLGGRGIGSTARTEEETAGR